MDSHALIHWQLQFTESFNHVVWRTLLREMTQERGGLAKSLILKDTKKAVILLFDVCILYHHTTAAKKSAFIMQLKKDGVVSIPNWKDFQLEPKVN